MRGPMGSLEGTPQEAGELTRLLRRWKGGDPEALEQLWPKVQGELQRVARAHMRGEHRGHTLQTTALVNEAFLRLVGQKRALASSRS